MQINSKKLSSAIIGIYSLLLLSFIILGLYVGSIILIPITLAILLAFLLTPLASRLEFFFGRILAVILIVIMMAMFIGLTSYIVGKELIQFTTDLPKYNTNIKTRIETLRIYNQNLITSTSTSHVVKPEKAETSVNAPTVNFIQRTLIDYSQVILNLFGFILGSFLNIVITILLILLLMSFLLIEREDLRGRFIRLIGQERIGATTSTINDAGMRVSRYLRMLLLVNIIYGLLVACGLHLLGIPNALLWGALSTILRFIPYVGVWIGAAIPIALSFAITSTWTLPVITIAFFVFLEALVSNILEPWLYGASTGVSATALIIAAIFWTFLWGPIGLILSTPITVCLVVLGRHVPQLEFLSILLSDEEPLAIYQEFYHRLLSTNMNEVMNLTDAYLKENSLTLFYDEVLIPVIVTAEIDIRKDQLDEDQIHLLYQNLEDLIEDLNARASSISTHESTIEKNIPEKIKVEKTKSQQIKKQHKVLILCLSAKTKGDELVGEMLVQLLKQNNYRAFNMLTSIKIEQIFEFMSRHQMEKIIISVISSSSLIKARSLARIIHNQFPQIQIILGFWNGKDQINEIKISMKTVGIDQVVTTLADLIAYFNAKI